MPLSTERKRKKCEGTKIRRLTTVLSGLLLMLVSPWWIEMNNIVVGGYFRNESSTPKWIVDSNVIRIHYVG